jgi:hypothetical protein
MLPLLRAVAWIDHQFYDGTIAGALRCFSALPAKATGTGRYVHRLWFY